MLCELEGLKISIPERIITMSRLMRYMLHGCPGFLSPSNISSSLTSEEGNNAMVVFSVGVGVGVGVVCGVYMSVITILWSGRN